MWLFQVLKVPQTDAMITVKVFESTKRQAKSARGEEAGLVAQWHIPIIKSCRVQAISNTSSPGKSFRKCWKAICFATLLS